MCKTTWIWNRSWEISELIYSGKGKRKYERHKNYHNCTKQSCQSIEDREEHEAKDI